MIREIRFSDEFDKAFKWLKKKYKSLPNDFKHKSDMESVSDAYLDDIILKIDRD